MPPLTDKTMYVRILSVHQVNAPIIRIGDIFFNVTSTLEPEISAHFSLSSSGKLTCEVNDMPIFSAMRKTSKFGILKRLLDIAAHTMVLVSSYEVNFYLPYYTEPKGILKQKFSLMDRRYELDMSLYRQKAIDRRLAIAAALISECD